MGRHDETASAGLTSLSCAGTRHGPSPSGECSSALCQRSDDTTTTAATTIISSMYTDVLLAGPNPMSRSDWPPADADRRRQPMQELPPSPTVQLNAGLVLRVSWPCLTTSHSFFKIFFIKCVSRRDSQYALIDCSELDLGQRVLVRFASLHQPL